MVIEKRAIEGQSVSFRRNAGSHRLLIRGYLFSWFGMVLDGQRYRKPSIVLMIFTKCFDDQF